MADTSAAGSLSAAWDGVTPATAPAGSIVLLAPGRDVAVGIDVRGTFVATITLETSVDGLNWSAPSVTLLNGLPSTATFTTPGSRLIAVSGAALLRARCSAYTSGAATVTMAGTPGGGGASSGGAGGAATIADGADAAQGTTTDAGIITDISGTVIGFLRGAILRWNTFLGRFPAALGGTTAAASLPVTLATDGQFVTSTGSLTETAPATDIASSGLNGRLQRLAQRLTSLILTQSSADTVALASAARTTTQNIDITVNNLSRMLLTIDVTAGSGGGITPSVNFKDPASGKFVILHAALTKITGIGTYTYAIGMGSPAAAGGVTAVVPFSLPTTARIALTVDDATPYTYSVGYCQMP